MAIHQEQAMNRTGRRFNLLFEISVSVGMAQHLAGPKRFLFTLLNFVVGCVCNQLFCCLR